MEVKIIIINVRLGIPISKKKVSQNINRYDLELCKKKGIHILLCTNGVFMKLAKEFITTLQQQGLRISWVEEVESLKY